MDTQNQVTVHVCGFGNVERSNYFGGKPIRRTELEVTLRKLKSKKAAGKDEVIGEMIKGGDIVMDWIWRLCNTAFESGVWPEDWRSAVIVPLYHGKEERKEYSNYRSII